MQLVAKPPHASRAVRCGSVGRVVKLAGCALAVTGLIVSPFAFSAEVESEEIALEEVVVVGSRGAPRTATSTTVPVDVFNQEALESVESVSLVDVISRLVPSFNVSRQPISDGATFVRPPTLRGLDSDKTLVLVNGKRRHRAGLVLLGGFGSHGPDLATIPSIAVKSVEVLRDGAAAQYGSDAIAGVMNFNLKDASQGIDIRAQAGEYDAGDGTSLILSGNVGLPLGNEGFLNLSLELTDADPTSRGGRYDIPIGSTGLTPEQAALTVLENAVVDGVAVGTRFGPDALSEFDVNGDGILDTITIGSDGIPDDPDTRFADNLAIPEQIWGEPDREAVRTFVNLGFPINDTTEVYAFGNFSRSDANGSFFYRRPGVSQLSPLRLEDGSIYNPRDDLFPGGFTPRFFGEVTDYSVAGGVRGEFSSGLTYDAYARYGKNEIAYTLENTINPSLGPDSPTEFRPGDLISDEFAIGVEFVLPVSVGADQPLYVAFGAEYREEGYEIVTGDALSFAIGPFASPDPFNFEITQAEADADPNDALTGPACLIPGLENPNGLCMAGDPINNVVPVGSNGFPGFSPEFSTNFERDNYALYVDLEQELGHFLFNAAGRFEDYSDFGTNFSWKTAGRYAISDNVSIRGSVGTGFRAPTPGQISTVNVSTRIDPNGFPVAEGIFPAEDPVSQLFGAQPLDAEESTQFTVGIAATPTDNFTISLDYYFIELEDRIVLSSDFAVGPDEVAQLEALGVPGANSIAQVSFFNNDLTTETQGIDLVADYNLNWNTGANTQFTASFNWNRTEITDRTSRFDATGAEFFFVNDETVFDEEEGLPQFRGIFSIAHNWSAFSVLARANYFGSYENASNATLTSIQEFDPEVLVDVNATWNITDQYSVTVGGQNVFDNFPDRGEFEVCCGREFRSDSVVSWQGAFYFLRFSANL